VFYALSEYFLHKDDDEEGRKGDCLVVNVSPYEKDDGSYRYNQPERYSYCQLL